MPTCKYDIRPGCRRGYVALYVNDLPFTPVALGLHVSWPTAYEALVGRAALKAGGSPARHILHLCGPRCIVGEWVLITAAAGGAGLAAVQLAKCRSFANM